MRQPVAAARTDPTRYLRFRFDRADETHWPLHRIVRADLQRLMKRLKYFESLTLEQAQQNKVIGEYDMGDCPNKSATKVLAQQYEGQDTLTKLVVEPSGPGRLFAIREGHELHVLWWDANHEVWPEGKTKR